jgi:hypothetical protein
VLTLFPFFSQAKPPDFVMLNPLPGFPSQPNF